MSQDTKEMSRERKFEIASSLSNFDMLVLDWFVAVDGDELTVWEACEAVGIPRFVGGDVMRRLVGLGLLTTIYKPRPVWERKAVATEKGKAISAFYSSELFHA